MKLTILQFYLFLAIVITGCSGNRDDYSELPDLEFTDVWPYDVDDRYERFKYFVTSDARKERARERCVESVVYQGYEYKTVLIGNQCWFAENLRCSNYRNGDSIPSDISAQVWGEGDFGMTTFLGERKNLLDVLPENFSKTYSLFKYGRLYNWHAVVDERGLCPNGWHVPTDGEWARMESALGMSWDEINGRTSSRGAEQVTKMKATSGWFETDDGRSLNLNGSNSSGFSALPGGFREHIGFNFGLKFDGNWWTSSYGGGQPVARRIDRGITRLRREAGCGFSVRCVMDAE